MYLVYSVILETVTQVEWMIQFKSIKKKKIVNQAKRFGHVETKIKLIMLHLTLHNSNIALQKRARLYTFLYVNIEVIGAFSTKFFENMIKFNKFIIMESKTKRFNNILSIIILFYSQRINQSIVR